MKTNKLARRPRGRPPIGDTPTVSIAVRVPMSMAKLIIKAAKKQRLSVSAWIRQALDRAINQ